MTATNPTTTEAVSGHTPGPWSVRWQDVGAQQRHSAIYGPKVGWGRGIAVLAHTHGARDKPENTANARLIAAAPDLLEALEELFVRGDVQIAFAGNPNACEALEAKCRSAIARARGEG